VAQLELVELHKSYGSTAVISALNLQVNAGEFLVLVGPSGCGKSSILRLVAGLESLTQGQILLNQHNITELSPKDRNVAMVFQNYALYPHMSVAENMEFGLRLAGVAKATRQRRVAEVAQQLGIETLLARKPKALSGGQRQRVALGRAIVRDPALFLFDEPLSNLDAELRVLMRAEIAKLQRQLKTTTVYVTHDQVEAMTLGHRIAVLAPLSAQNLTNLQQIGTPREIYDTPSNVFVAKFLGSPSMNVFSVPMAGLSALGALADFSLESQASQAIAAQIGPLIAPHSHVLMGIRPEHWRSEHPGDAVKMSITVEMLEIVGSEMLVYGHCRISEPTRLIARLPADHPVHIGGRLKLSAAVKHLHFFHPHSQQRLAI
jgi:multiple sugar transport system ATP-binding protein